jgi:hypothetical protein
MMFHHVYSRQLVGFLVLNLESKEAAKEWKERYLAAQHLSKETLDIVSTETPSHKWD